MTRLLLVTLTVGVPLAAASFRVEGTDPAPWTKIFESVGIAPAADASIVVATGDAKVDVQALAADRIVVIQGTGLAAEAAGIVAKTETVQIRQIRDIHAPDTQIIWESPVTANLVQLPAEYQVFASERWKNAPVLAGKRTARGAILWLATPPGSSGYERYPYLLHALADLGMTFRARATNMWAFFDSSYRIRADVDYIAHRLRQSGVGVLHVAAWHNMNGDPAQDEYLKRLIEACHRNAIVVYAWLELPHVSDKFWEDHPAWREKTALGQDAQLDWRKLMNLANPECQREARQIASLIDSFDWDGVNLAELYFESLEGAANPARFTPLNNNVRAEFSEIAGFDPKLLFDATSKYAKDSAAFRKFLDFRVVLAARMQADWLKQMDALRARKPYLDVVLTHIDDRFDSAIRDDLGADVARALPVAIAHGATLLVEDPATLWNLGPERYAKLAAKYSELGPNGKNVAIDINVVERYQDVYPTKKQTGVELFELVHQAAKSFSHLAVYVENSIEKQDLAILPAAATVARTVAQGPDQVDIEAPESVRVPWQGPAELDGKVWPAQNRDAVLVPAGKHRLSTGFAEAPITLADFNGELRSAVVNGDSVDISYASRSRAIAVLARSVSRVEVDGQGLPPTSETSLILPAGEHVLTMAR